MSSGNCRVGGKPSTADASTACASASRFAALQSFARDSAARSSKLRAFCNCAMAIATCKDGRRGIGRVALQQDLGTDAVHLRFVPALLGERVVQAPEHGISLAGTRFGFGQGHFETGQEPIPTLLPIDGEAA